MNIFSGNDVNLQNNYLNQSENYLNHAISNI